MSISKEELARRLRAAREACHLTQEEIALRLGVSRSTIAQMEGGKRAVSSLELDKLAYLYGRDIRVLLADEFREEDALAALFRLHPEVSQKEDILAALRESVGLGREVTNLERLLGIERDRAALPLYLVRPAQSRWQAVRQGEHAALEERRRLQLGDAPLPDVAEVLESQGVRTAQLLLPEDLSGLTLFDPEIGPFVVVNNREPGHSRLRRRFSHAHEYCHVLLDREQKGTISWTSERDTFLEVRANAFAAAFLMPRAGVQDFVRGLGKGLVSRLQADIFDEEEAEPVQTRPDAGTQTLQMHDVVLVAHHFAVSRLAALFRLKNLGFLTQPELDALKQQECDGVGRKLERLLGLPESEAAAARGEFRHRFLALGLEAFRRGEITRSKLRELAEMVRASPPELDDVLALSGLGVDDDVPRRVR
ncbi:MAG: ImmA/IrrE family metallo-endopeptidase [Planctomycetes bacterium]|nr:ImmA/IrrE family metallo-endopeptidase [Planctomycetota bacterium]